MNYYKISIDLHILPLKCVFSCIAIFTLTLFSLAISFSYYHILCNYFFGYIPCICFLLQRCLFTIGFLCNIFVFVLYFFPLHLFCVQLSSSIFGNCCLRVIFLCNLSFCNIIVCCNCFSLQHCFPLQIFFFSLSLTLFPSPVTSFFFLYCRPLLFYSYHINFNTLPPTHNLANFYLFIYFRSIHRSRV